MTQIIATSNDQRKARQERYRPGPRVPMSSLREDLSEISDTRGYIFQAMAEGFSPPPDALDDLEDREWAIVVEIRARECTEDQRLRPTVYHGSTSQGRRGTD